LQIAELVKIFYSREESIPVNLVALERLFGSNVRHFVQAIMETDANQIPNLEKTIAQDKELYKQEAN